MCTARLTLASMKIWLHRPRARRRVHVLSRYKSRQRTKACAGARARVRSRSSSTSTSTVYKGWRARSRPAIRLTSCCYRRARGGRGAVPSAHRAWTRVGRPHTARTTRTATHTLVTYTTACDPGALTKTRADARTFNTASLTTTTTLHPTASCCRATSCGSACGCLPGRLSSWLRLLRCRRGGQRQLVPHGQAGAAEAFAGAEALLGNLLDKALAVGGNAPQALWHTFGHETDLRELLVWRQRNRVVDCQHAAAAHRNVLVLLLRLERRAVERGVQHLFVCVSAAIRVALLKCMRLLEYHH
mmetsp:Transcript_469/g.949  ORF Transcript_469/g.949 Transcript_469/m.949 type:complete len:301 (-) Transcript_469:571-1473(-)